MLTDQRLDLISVYFAPNVVVFFFFFFFFFFFSSGNRFTFVADVCVVIARCRHNSWLCSCWSLDLSVPQSLHWRTPLFPCQRLPLTFFFFFFFFVLRLLCIGSKSDELLKQNMNVSSTTSFTKNIVELPPRFALSLASNPAGGDVLVTVGASAGVNTTTTYFPTGYWHWRDGVRTVRLCARRRHQHRSETLWCNDNFESHGAGGAQVDDPILYCCHGSQCVVAGADRCDQRRPERRHCVEHQRARALSQQERLEHDNYRSVHLHQSVQRSGGGFDCGRPRQRRRSTPTLWCKLGQSLWFCSIQ
jgi:hypothetical protein